MHGMTDEAGERDAAAVASIRAALRDAVQSLTGAGARQEALAEYIPARRTLVIHR